ncbi:hypothetical protein E2C01_095983 [Portunus trituberculatus]|uniref:RNase H type-1 domain-containing protein n=1 Tax=Portunus trituberculatus TaxID=210409 RepID=A0A5B7K5F2_PORTR|nr:hypothetical protein [Portunus trituberculatus]
MGGIKLAVCKDIVIQIWDWCVANGAWVTCSHIPGKENTAADTASRIINDRHEWQLNVHIFRQLCGVFGTPVIDLFTSRLNNQVFSLNWAQFELSYIFPPFALITRCLQKLKAEVAGTCMDGSAVVDVATLDGPAALPASGSSPSYYAEEGGSESPILHGGCTRS